MTDTSPAGGSVTDSDASTDEAIEIAVADTGVGIDAQNIPYVFERFWRADRARASADSATRGFAHSTVTQAPPRVFGKPRGLSSGAHGRPESTAF